MKRPPEKIWSICVRLCQLVSLFISHEHIYRKPTRRNNDEVTAARTEAASKCFDCFVELVGNIKGNSSFSFVLPDVSSCVWLPFSNADTGLFCWMIATSRDTKLLRLCKISFLSSTFKFWWSCHGHRTSLCLFDWLKIISPTQSGFTVSDKTPWDVMKKKKNSPVSLKMNESKVCGHLFLFFIKLFRPLGGAVVARLCNKNIDIKGRIKGLVGPSRLPCPYTKQ